MSATDRTDKDKCDLRRFWGLVAAACVATAVAATAGLVLGIADPGDGSTGDDRFRTFVAVGGLAVGALFGAAAILAQVKESVAVRSTVVSLSRVGCSGCRCDRGDRQFRGELELAATTGATSGIARPERRDPVQHPARFCRLSRSF